MAQSDDQRVIVGRLHADRRRIFEFSLGVCLSVDDIEKNIGVLRARFSD